MNGTKILDSNVGPYLFVLPYLLKEVQCEYYNIFLGYYQCGQNPQSWQGRNEENTLISGHAFAASQLQTSEEPEMTPQL